MRQNLRIILLAAILAGAPTVALAADSGDSGSDWGLDRDRLEGLTRESVDRFMEFLQRLRGQMPEFRMPEITPEGDILIHPPRPRSTPQEPEIVET